MLMDENIRSSIIHNPFCSPNRILRTGVLQTAESMDGAFKKTFPKQILIKQEKAGLKRTYAIINSLALLSYSCCSVPLEMRRAK